MEITAEKVGQRRADSTRKTAVDGAETKTRKENEAVAEIHIAVCHGRHGNVNECGGAGESRKQSGKDQLFNLGVVHFSFLLFSKL